MNYKRINLGDNIGFSTIIDEKFNTCSVSVKLITELSPETAAAKYLAADILSISNSRIPTLAGMNERLSSLYGASVGSSCTSRGDLQLVTLSASWLNDRFAIDGEGITAEMLEIICDCLFSPNIVDGAFEEEAFNIAKNDLLDTIDGQINDKRSYAVSQLRRKAFEGEPAGYPETGTREDAENVTAVDAYRVYQELLKTAQVEIFYVANEENDSVAEMFREAFSKIERCPGSYKFRTPSPVKAETAVVEEILDVRQSKFALAMKSSSDDIFALKLFAVILGGTPSSKLFMNVREKQSLCYYCACRYSETKNYILIDCGVELDKIQAAHEEILRQIDDMKQGNITDDEIGAAILSLENAYLAVGDTAFGSISWYFDAFCSGEIITPEEYFRRISGVTRERLMAAASSLTTDTIYKMLSREETK
ncbi:MAG: insulinase family protein [Alistipes sp.]|nr:insulinase family protein [Alistipes sp.]